MRITKLHIYGFGKFYDVQVSLLSSGLQVIYGENEKGKSTIKSFISTILFGFPTKAQAGSHYEPKQGTKYGGKLTIETEELGDVTIERQKGKNSGKAIVYFSDGSVGGDEALRKLLGGMSKDLFTGIFSFSASDLQKIEQLKTDEINQYLHGASILGKGSLLDLEKKLEKGQQELFKPSGKRPILNEKLEQLEDVHQQMKVIEGQLTQYNDLLSQRDELRNRQLELNDTITNLKEKVKLQENLRIIEPLYIKEKGIIAQLNQLPPVENFPMHGIDQVKDSLAKEQTLKEQLNDLEAELEELNQNVKTINLRSNFEQVKEQALSFKGSYYEYEKLKEELSSIELELDKLQQIITEQTERVGKEWSSNLILNTQISLTAKDDLKKLAQRERKSYYEKEQLEVELKTKSLHHKQTTRTIQELSSQCLAKEEQIHLQQQMKKAKDERAERKDIEQNIQWLNFQIRESLNRNDNTWLFKWIALVFLGISGWLLYIVQWVPALLAFSSAIILIYTSRRVKNTENRQLKYQLKEYEGKLENMQPIGVLDGNIERLDRILKEDEVRKNQLDLWNKQKLQEEKGYSLLVEEFELCRNEIELIHNQLEEWCKKYQFIHYGNCEHQLEMFGLIVDTKQHLNKKNYFEKRKKEVELRVSQIEQYGQKIADKLLIKGKNSFAALVHKVTEVVESEQTARLEATARKKEIKKLEDEIEGLNRKIRFLKEERSKWLLKSNTKDEEEFFYYAKVATECQALEKELILLRSQQKQLITDPLKQEQISAYLEKRNQNHYEKLETLIEQLDTTEEQQFQLQNQIGRLDQEIERLEAGTNHSQLRQAYEIKKEEFEQIAKEWAKYRIGQWILSQAKSIYETERQPMVIQKAKEMFSLMTNGEYINLIAPVSENTFIVERQDGVRFSPEELSQGTGEQLYLSIRLALAIAYQAPYPMPIILDDIMVNFDDVRKDHAKRVVENVATEHQVLFFTCHEQIKNLFEKETRMVLT